jgi:hypothetical protein
VSRLSRHCRILNISQPYKHPRPVTGIALLYGDGVYFISQLTVSQLSRQCGILNTSQPYRPHRPSFCLMERIKVTYSLRLPYGSLLSAAGEKQHKNPRKYLSCLVVPILLSIFRNNKLHKHALRLWEGAACSNAQNATTFLNFLNVITQGPAGKPDVFKLALI